MKKLALILISIIVAAAFVAVGWWIGFQQRLLTEAYAVPTVDKQLSQVAVDFGMFRQLDSGRTADAKHTLKLRLDGDIASVYNLIDYTDVRTKESARKIFAAIADYRAAHPYNYTGPLANADVEADARIAAILQVAKEASDPSIQEQVARQK